MEYIEKLRFREEIQLRSRWSSGLIVGGKVLLWMNLLLVWFWNMSTRDGSNFWLWWVVVETIVGAVAVLGGKLYQSRHVS